jgi:hypothetical protein
MGSPVVGNAGKINLGGVALALTNEACTAIADDAAGRHRYQITNAAKRVLDPNTAIVPKENAGGTTTSAANIYAVDALAGIITYASGYTPVATVGITGKYIPRAALAYVKSAKSAIKLSTTPTTDLNQGYEKCIPALLGWSGSLELFDDPTDATQNLATPLTGKTAVLLDLVPAGDAANDVRRGWVLLTDETQPIEPGAAVVNQATFTMFDQSKTASDLSGFQVNAAVYAGAP